METSRERIRLLLAAQGSSLWMIALAELVIDALKYVLRLRMAARHTTKTIPKITAYSTAVWPPSLLTNGRIRKIPRRMSCPWVESLRIYPTQV